MFILDVVKGKWNMQLKRKRPVDGNCKTFPFNFHREFPLYLTTQGSYDPVLSYMELSSVKATRLKHF
jgi:hypothetical protein